LSPEEEDRLAIIPTENLAAYEAYLHGRQRIAEETAASLAEAIDYFEQAIELDPTFALAYVGLAYGYSWQFWRGGLPPEKALAKAQAAADKALDLDDRLGEAYSALAGIKQARFDFEGAEATFQRALELNPNDATAYYWYGDLLGSALGRAEEALVLHRKALALDPFSVGIMNSIANDLESLGRFDEALAGYEKALEVDPNFAESYFNVGYFHLTVSGRLDDAVVWARKGIALDLGNPQYPAILGFIFLNLGDPSKAEFWINRSIKLGPENSIPNFAMHALHLYRGDEAAALDYARRTVAADPNFVPVILRDSEIKAGRYPEARTMYEKRHPELLDGGDSTVDGSNWRAAIALALVLAKTGEQEHADLLLNRSLEYIQRHPRLGWLGYGIADVQIYALQGKKQKALAALRQAIDEGWRSIWGYYLKNDLNLESLHDEPEFQAMVAEIEADMAAQLARVREMERNGELEPIPEASAAIQ
jgi:tetratricopeptide (TPR) repeat protein